MRDLVFDALRKRASCAALGGGLHGRGLMLGLGMQDGWQLSEIFSGTGHAPDALSPDEELRIRAPETLSGATAVDVPDWIWAQFQDDLGDNALDAATQLRSRAGLFLRVNQRRASMAEAQAALADEGIATEPHVSQTGCLRVTANPRRVQRAKAYLDGLVEVQDAASQIAVTGLDIPAGAAVLDYCAGGGGKALAIADRFDCAVTAHDHNVQRMADLPRRAERAGVEVKIAEPQQLAPDQRFDVVIVDAPCTGSGTWRRNPEAKWALESKKLQEFSKIQADILARSTGFLAQGGLLVYMTCSIFRAENEGVIDGFLSERADFQSASALSLYPSPDWDGFFCQALANNA